MSIVSAIVDKQHASMHWRRVLRIVIGRMKGGKTGYKRLDRETRRQIACEVHERHQQNAAIYRAVMYGTIKF